MAALQSQGAQHGPVPSREGYGGPAASETSLDGAAPGVPADGGPCPPAPGGIGGGA